MKKWVIARGPDKDKALEKASELARPKGKGKLVNQVAGNIELEKLEDGSVTLVYLKDKDYAVHVVDETYTRFMILAIGINSSAEAVRLSQGMQELGTVAVLSTKGFTTFPEGEDPDKCHTVIIDYPSEDTEVIHMVSDAEAYFGWIKSRKHYSKRVIK